MCLAECTPQGCLFLERFSSAEGREGNSPLLTATPHTLSGVHVGIFPLRLAHLYQNIDCIGKGHLSSGANGRKLARNRTCNCDCIHWPQSLVLLREKTTTNPPKLQSFPFLFGPKSLFCCVRPTCGKQHHVLVRVLLPAADNLSSS